MDTIDLPAGAMIRSKESCFAIHVGILVGYPRDFVGYLPAAVRANLSMLEEDKMYVVSKRNYGGGISGAGIPGPVYGVNGIVLERLRDAFAQGARACPFGGTRKPFDETVKCAMECLLDPGDLGEFRLDGGNCQDFAVCVATKDRDRGLVRDQSENYAVGSVVLAGAGLLLAPLTFGTSLGLTAAGVGGFVYNADRANAANNPY